EQGGGLDPPCAGHGHDAQMLVEDLGHGRAARSGMPGKGALKSTAAEVEDVIAAVRFGHAQTEVEFHRPVEGVPDLGAEGSRRADLGGDLRRPVGTTGGTALVTGEEVGEEHVLIGPGDEGEVLSGPRRVSGPGDAV